MGYLWTTRIANFNCIMSSINDIWCFNNTQCIFLLIVTNDCNNIFKFNFIFNKVGTMWMVIKVIVTVEHPCSYINMYYSFSKVNFTHGCFTLLFSRIANTRPRNLKEILCSTKLLPANLLQRLRSNIFQSR